MGDDEISLPAAGADHRVPTQLFQFGENPGDWAGILAHLAASQLFPETMEEGLAATTNRRGNAGCCVWMSIAVYSRLLDKRWTRKLFYAVST